MALGWMKSTFCGTNACVEVARKACGSTTCVEVAHCDCDLYYLRDSKDPAGPVLRFTAAEWDAFIAGVKDGEFDV
jgi:hypothetical protein